MYLSNINAQNRIVSSSSVLPFFVELYCAESYDILVTTKRTQKSEQ